MKQRRALSFLLALAAAACGSTNPSSPYAKIVDTYRARGTVSFVYDKAAVLVLNGGPDLRRTIEAQVAASAGNPKLFAAHSVLTIDDMRSAAAMRRKLLDQKFDGLLVMRVVRPNEVNPGETIPGETFSSYASSVDEGAPPFGEGKLLLETSVYRLESEKLLWRALVEADSTEGAQAMVRHAVNVMRGDLQRTGLIHE